jgi:hypothetical protein
LSVWRTVSWEIVSTISSSTATLANNRNDQWAYPSGGWLRTRVISCASCALLSLARLEGAQ